MFIDPKHVMTMPKFMTNTPDTKSQLAKAKMEADAATNKLYAAEAAHEKAEKNKNVQTTAKKVKETAALVQQTKVAADSAKLFFACSSNLAWSSKFFLASALDCAEAAMFSSYAF